MQYLESSVSLMMSLKVKFAKPVKFAIYNNQCDSFTNKEKWVQTKKDKSSSFLLSSDSSF